MGENPPRLNWGSLLDIQTFCGYRMSSEDIQLQRQTERTYCFPEFNKVVNKVMERGGGAPSPHSAQFLFTVEQLFGICHPHQKQDWYTGVNIIIV